MRTVSGLTNIYSVNTSVTENNSVSAKVTTAAISKPFMVYVKVENTDTSDTLANKIHYAAQFHCRVIGFGISNQLCHTTWVGDSTYNLKFILSNNKTYSISASDSDSDTTIRMEIESACAYSTGTTTERDIRMAKIADLRATL